MKRLMWKYIKQPGNVVCDVGSYDVNGTYKDIFVNDKYIGVDIQKGPNVDVVSKEEYKYPFPSDHFDAVISGQTIEHVRDLYRFVQEMARICKPEGFVIIICPMIQPIHHKPIDCWRILPDGMKFLLSDIAKLKIREVFHSSDHRDCWGVGQKPYPEYANRSYDYPALELDKYWEC